MKLTLYALASDRTHHGTELFFFTSEKALQEHRRGIIIESLDEDLPDDAKEGEESAQIRALAQTDIDEAWDKWSESRFRDHLDTFTWDLHDIELSGLDELLAVADAVLAQKADGMDRSDFTVSQARLGIDKLRDLFAAKQPEVTYPPMAGTAIR